jgi:hypothetical protein
MSIDFRAGLEGILIEGHCDGGRPVSVLHASGPRLDADQPAWRHVAAAACECIQLRVKGGMRSPVGIVAGAADRVSAGGWHV